MHYKKKLIKENHYFFYYIRLKYFFTHGNLILIKIKITLLIQLTVNLFV